MAKEKTDATEAPKKIDEVVEAIQAEATETPAAKDYTKYAGQAAVPTSTERRKFDLILVSGAVDTEVMEDGVTEKRKPATAVKLFMTRPRTADDRSETEVLTLPLNIIPIKYRMIMEHRIGNKGETIVLKSSEYNGKTSDKVVITRFTPDGKVEAKYGPMTVLEARKMFQSAEGKGLLRDKVHLYALHNGEVVCFTVKGASLWEDRAKLINGKTEASRKEYPYLSEYLSTFPMTEPYFLFEMKVDAAYRDHGQSKYYRPTFEKGTRISDEVETKVLTALDDLHDYFADIDKETAAFVADTPAPAGAVVVEGNPEDKPF